MGSQQRGASLFQRQAPAITRDGDETHVARIGMQDDAIEQTTDENALPVLCTVKAAGTVQRCIQSIASRDQFVVGEAAGRFDRAAKGEPPRLCVQWARRIGYPA